MVSSGGYASTRSAAAIDDLTPSARVSAIKLPSARLDSSFAALASSRNSAALPATSAPSGEMLLKSPSSDFAASRGFGSRELIGQNPRSIDGMSQCTAECRVTHQRPSQVRHEQVQAGRSIRLDHQLIGTGNRRRVPRADPIDDFDLAATQGL